MNPNRLRALCRAMMFQYQVLLGAATVPRLSVFTSSRASMPPPLRRASPMPPPFLVEISAMFVLVDRWSIGMTGLYHMLTPCA